MSDQPATPKTLNAIILVPGIMGSELVDQSGKVVWGLDPMVLGKGWLTPSLLELRPTEEELTGQPRLRPTRLLRVPGYLPMLRGIEPYTAMLTQLQQMTIRSEAVAEFPYDWRLSIDFNAGRLVTLARQHLEAWKKTVDAGGLGDPATVKLTIVAHSMGGLVARCAARIHGLDAVLGDLITVGTPFFGSLNALETMATGQSNAFLPRRKVRELALSCPGLYDLTPRYRCVVDGADLRPLSVEDMADIGGNPDLATAAAVRWESLQLRQEDPSGSVWAEMLAVVGAKQPTAQSVTIQSGSCSFHRSLGGEDHSGDSTVYFGAAKPLGVTAVPVAQKHGSLMKAPEVLTQVEFRPQGQTVVHLGTRPISADIPDLVAAGTAPQVTVATPDGQPTGLTVISTELATKRPSNPWSQRQSADGRLTFTGQVLRPGLHRVEVSGGGFSPVSDLMMVEEL